MSKTNINNDLAKKFASLLYKDIQMYIKDHQNEYEAWQINEEREASLKEDQLPMSKRNTA